MRMDLGLLVMRLLSGSFMLFGHGVGKMRGFSALMATFPDPLGIGSTASLALAVFAEVVCSILVMLGLATRLACIPLLTTMLVAASLVHAEDPWAKKEFALLYAMQFLTLIFTGPGLFSVDAVLKGSPKLLRP